MSVETTDFMVRQAIPEDAAGLALMHSESFKTAYLNDNPERNAGVLVEALTMTTPGRIKLREELILRAAANGDSELYYDAIDANTQLPIGLIYGYKTPDVQELYALYTNPAHFGRGIGHALVSEFISWSDPTRPVELGVVSDNERAKSFYQKMGFYATGELHAFSFEFLPEITMRRPGDQQ